MRNLINNFAGTDFCMCKILWEGKTYKGLLSLWFYRNEKENYTSKTFMTFYFCFSTDRNKCQTAHSRFQLSNFGKIYKQLNFEAHSLMRSFWTEEYLFAQEDLCRDIKTHTKTTGISGCEIERVSSSSQSGLHLFFTTRLFTFCKIIHFIRP